jgi:integrase
MPRLVNKLPSYRRHKATGQAVVSLGGQDIYLGPWKSVASKTEYQRRIREWQAAGGVTTSDVSGLTVVELLAAFKRHARTYYVDVVGNPNTEYKNYATVMQRLGTAYGRTLACEFGPLRLKAFRQSLIERRLSRTHVNHSINRVRHIFKWAVENELVPASVIDALRCVAGLRYGKSDVKETEPVRPVPDARVNAVLPHVSPQVKAMIELQRVTGMRSGEVCRMRGCDLNTSGNVWTYTPASHKTMYRGHSRIVYLGPKAKEILGHWLRSNTQEYLFQPREAEEFRRQVQQARRKTPLSCGNRPGSNRRRRPAKSPGYHFTSGSYGRAIRVGCELAFGMPQELRRPAKGETPEQKLERQRLAVEWRAENTWHPHQLRHNAATYFRREHGLEVARVLLGHKHAAITEVYAEADRARAVEVAARIG